MKAFFDKLIRCCAAILSTISAILIVAAGRGLIPADNWTARFSISLGGAFCCVVYLFISRDHFRWWFFGAFFLVIVIGFLFPAL
jgi:hypothetical protein